MSPQIRSHAIERALRAEGRLAAGVDEVGRGPLAGPVVACAVVMPLTARRICGVGDSKVVTRLERERLAPLIMARAVAFGVGAASVDEIDGINILQATVRAMQRAIRRLGMAPDALLVDGRPLPTLGMAHHGIIDGDARCYSIACASIVAKVTRDRLMRSLAAKYPNYGWDRNAGYATEEHRDAILRHGTTRHHRRTFLGKLEQGELFGRERGGEESGVAESR